MKRWRASVAASGQLDDPAPFHGALQPRERMQIHPTPLDGLKLIGIEPRTDARGFFARVFCEQELARAGLEARIAQMNISLNTNAGTLRGLRYQLPPVSEIKIICCVRGALFDFAVDLRSNSPTFKRWFGWELNDVNRMMMYIPHGFAHGYITLADNTEVLYAVSAPYSPECERGVRFDDPAFAIQLPRAVAEIAQKDRDWPDYPG
jgi:dTDP-4-dehydrorhamnose 3,5-epimerase